ncbi:MAG: hypothetical protein JO157_10370 [Acetobacteraceae bacterium]|nr:hypothetical protein [Acetobacteraceae bacterium]
MRRLAVLALVLALSACGPDRGAEQRAFLASLVGRPESSAVQALGVPDRTYEASGVRFLAYDQQRVVAARGGPFVGGCELTLTVAGDRVQSWTMRGTVCSAGTGGDWLAFGMP